MTLICPNSCFVSFGTSVISGVTILSLLPLHLLLKMWFDCGAQCVEVCRHNKHVPFLCTCQQHQITVMLKHALLIREVMEKAAVQVM